MPHACVHTWYRGPTLFQTLDDTEVPARDPLAPFRMAVIDKFKDLGTVVMGKSESGAVRKGDHPAAHAQQVRPHPTRAPTLKSLPASYVIPVRRTRCCSCPISEHRHPAQPRCPHLHALSELECGDFSRLAGQTNEVRGLCQDIAVDGRCTCHVMHRCFDFADSNEQQQPILMSRMCRRATRGTPQRLGFGKTQVRSMAGLGAFSSTPIST